MADDALTVVKGTLEDNVGDRQVEFVGEIDGEEYQFAVQYDVLEALSGDVPEGDAVELFERYSDDILEAALTALGREDAALLARSDPAAAPLYARLAAADVPFSLRELHLTGEDVMHLASVSGKAVGEILHRAFLYCLSHPGENTNERLRSLCRSGFFSERNPKNQPE